MISGAQRRSGTVLLIVAVMVMLLSLVAYKFLLSMETEHMAVALRGDRLQAYQSARSAEDLLRVLLQKDRATRERFGGLTDNPAYFAGHTAVLREATAMELGAVATPQPPLGLIAYALEETKLAGPRYPQTADPVLQSTDPLLGYPPTRYGAINESSKLHLMKVLEWETEKPGVGVTALMSLPGMDESTAEALLDWLDADDSARPLGAESEFYATLSRPLAPRNGVPVELDELLFVRGVTSQRLHGETAELPINKGGSDSMHRNAPLESFTNQGSNDPWTDWQGPPSRVVEYDASAIRPWRELLTIHSAERNESYTGRERIFINNEDLDELHTQLVRSVSQEWADFIVLYRQYGPSSQTSSRGNSEPPPSIIVDLQLAPGFAIENPVDLIGATIAIPSDDESEPDLLVNSPVDAETIAFRNDIAQLFDLMTAFPGKRIAGRININEAPAEVLAALPGISDETVETIVSSRDRANQEVTERIHPIWLVTEGIVDLPTMRILLPNVTCGGDVYLAEIWGRSEGETALARFETVLDASTDDCQSVYYRNLDAPRSNIKILSSEEFESLGIDFEPPEPIAES